MTALGPLVKDIEIGQRVAMLSDHAYAEFDIASRDCVVPLPEELMMATMRAELCA